ncbi:MAG: 30S ribosomal protein S13 [Candidatus Spechtbacterales bacterium]
MARVAGIDIPDEKRIEIALTYIHGVGRSLGKKILSDLKLDKNTHTKDLTQDQLNALRTEVSKYKIEGDLRREVHDNIKRLREIGSYRGSRHAANLPSRGQRTKTNSRTVRGNKRITVGSGKKPPSSPT